MNKLPRTCSLPVGSPGAWLVPFRLHLSLRSRARNPVAGNATSSLADGSDMQDSTKHTPVLLQEVLLHFQPVNIKVYVDCTLGAGGHATAIAQQHEEMQTLVGIDVDPVAQALAQTKIRGLNRSGLQPLFVQQYYSNLGRIMDNAPSGSLMGKVDAMLMDLGISSMQVDDGDRGFSFMKEGPLDMRMGPSASISAEQLVNTWPEAEIGRIIRDYGEEKLWKLVARRISNAREQEPIRTTQQLVKAIGYTQLKSKGGRSQGKGIHPATRTFQALRIAVNDEINRLEQVLPVAIQSLSPGGRLAVISFHSLEDRVVKHAFLKAIGRALPSEEEQLYGANKFAFLDQLDARKIGVLVTRKAVAATPQEVEENPRSRSAKLRVFQKL